MFLLGCIILTVCCGIGILMMVDSNLSGIVPFVIGMIFGFVFIFGDINNIDKNDFHFDKYILTSNYNGLHFVKPAKIKVMANNAPWYIFTKTEFTYTVISMDNETNEK